MDIEGDVLAVIHQLCMANKLPLSIKAITCAYRKVHGNELTQITPKWVGGIIRNKLHLKTQKSNGVYVIPHTEAKKLFYLFEKYGVVPQSDDG